jgi:outer membrane protein assembly factor BamB
VKKTRFLVLSTVLVMGGVLLAACGGQVVATGAPGLTVLGDRAYLASGGSVHSIDLATGQEATTTDNNGKTVPLRFPAQSRNNAFGSVPAIVSDTQMVIGNAYSNDRKHFFYSFDPHTMAPSSPSWPYEGAHDLWMGSPIVLDGSIYAPNSDGKLYVFSPDGRLVGTFATGGSLWSQPATDGKTLYVASMDHSVYAVDPANLSNAIWQTELDASIVSGVAVKDGKLYAGTINNSLYALDAASGDILWHVTLDGSIWGTPAVAAIADAEEEAAPEAGTTPAANASPEPSATEAPTATPEATSATGCETPGEALYIGTETDTQGGTLYAINTADGCTLWTLPTASAIASSAIVNENTIYFVTENGMIQAVSSDGTTLWQQPVKGQFFSAPVLAGDLLLIAPAKNGDFQLVAYALDGKQRWTYPVPKK